MKIFPKSQDNPSAAVHGSSGFFRDDDSEKDGDDEKDGKTNQPVRSCSIGTSAYAVVRVTDTAALFWCLRDPGIMFVLTCIS